MTAALPVADKVRSALARELKRDPATITPEQALREDLGLNSLDAIELMFKVEEEFDLEIPDADLQRLRTVADLTSYLEERLGGAPTPAAPAPPRPAAAAKPAPAAPSAKRRMTPAPAGGKRSAKRSRA
jgi:acyl carrier protein